jgi:D-glycero-D-manno-heptose 1,7-bisphosphate phosphatase
MVNVMKSAVFLDRDGVINKAQIFKGKPQSAKSLAELVVLPGVKESITDLHTMGLEVVVVTNQPDVARERLAKDKVCEIESELKELLGIKYFYTCFHDDRDECECRKPKAGLLITAAQDLGVNLLNSYLIGDRWKDIEAGQSVGCRCFFIDYAYSEKKPIQPFTAVDSLKDAVAVIRRGVNWSNPLMT